MLFRKSQPFQHIGQCQFNKVNIFRQKKCAKIFSKKSIYICFWFFVAKHWYRKIVTLSKYHCPMCWNGWDFRKKKTHEKTHFLHWTIWEPPLKMKISKIGLRHILSWPKLDPEPKFHDPGFFRSFFLALDRLCPLNKNIYKSLIFTLNVCKNILGDPLKKGNFSKKIFLHLLISKIFTLSKFHSPICWNGWDFRKKREKHIFLTLDHMGTPP